MVAAGKKSHIGLVFTATVCGSVAVTVSTVLGRQIQWEAVGGMDSLHERAPQLNVAGGAEQTLKFMPTRVGFYRDHMKRFLDLMVGTVLLLVVWPLIAACACLVALGLGMPVFYTQDRVGLDGRHFRLYKLRTMIPDRRAGRGGYIGPERRMSHKTTEDPRVPMVGKILRATRFDELPQLLNVLKGDMSLVGPRPELPDIVAGYEDWQHQRHVVKPGLTGLWQVSNHNGKPMHECTDMDLEYIASMSFSSDLAILLRTPVAMLNRRGF